MNREIDILREIKSIAYFMGNTPHPESIKLKLSDFHFKAKNLQSLINVDPNKKQLINVLLDKHFILTEDSYLAGSPVSAIRKAKEVIKILNESSIDIKNFGFLSLGGGDGTELFYEIEYSEVNFGLLLEYHHESVKKFIDNIIPFKLRNSSRGIDLEVVECDLLDLKKIEATKNIISSKHLDGIIVTIHAVLHELYSRSSFDFDILTFFKRIKDLHENIILIIREPGISENWPEYLLINIDTNYREEFIKIIDILNRNHFNNKNLYEEFEDGIKIHKDLAIEALTKLFYYKDFDYEQDEKITSMSSEQILGALSKAGFKKIQSHTLFTESISINLNKFNVEIFNFDTRYPVGKPQCFTYAIAFKNVFKDI